MRLEGYSNYEIDIEQGTVWSYKSNRYIGSYDKDGYIITKLISDTGKQWHTSLHRLIWTVVNGKIPEGMEINHINEDKSANGISNLSLTSHQDNCNWGTRNERILKNRKGKYIPTPILALQNGDIKMFFPSTREAERNGFASSALCNCCHGKRKYAYGYQWQYVEDYLADWWDKEMDKYMENEKGVA